STSDVFLPPVLWHMFSQDTYQSVSLKLRVLPALECRHERPILPVASSVTLSRVVTPNTDGQTDYTRAIAEYLLSNTAPIRLGEVLRVPCENNASCVTCAADAAHVFVRVSRIRGGDTDTNVDTNGASDSVNADDQTADMWVTTDTAVSTHGSCHATVSPPLALVSSVISDCTVRDLYDTCRSTFSGRTGQFRTTLLLSARGNDKRRRLAQLAFACSAQYQEVCGSRMRVSADGLTGALAAFAKQLHRCLLTRDCLLHVRNFDRLFDLSDFENGKEPIQNVSSRVADSLRRIFEEAHRSVRHFSRSSKPVRVAVVCTADARRTTRKESPFVQRGVFDECVELAAGTTSQRAALASFYAISDSEASRKNLLQRTAGLPSHSLRVAASCAALDGLLSPDEDRLDVADRASKETAAAARLDSGATADIPDVKWSDVGGLAHVKQLVKETIELPLSRPELFGNGNVKRRSGLLFFGPPGTGKTLVAKAVASECRLAFLSVKGPELLDKYVGESERKVRQVFADARAARPSVLFFDELDSLAPARGGGADGGGVADRVVSSLLAELDALATSNDVFVLGATNRPDLLDAALLRPGRLDKCAYLGVPSDDSEQARVLKAVSRKFHMAQSVDFDALASTLPKCLTGADLYSLGNAAFSEAMRRQCVVLEEKAEEAGVPCDVFCEQLAQSNDDTLLHVVVQASDFEQAAAQLRPSLSPSELAKYEELRRQFGA
ncbi:MAG: hypothetical protein MHM6MM_005335, partial [Cercozoa sp. M6MM]